MKFQTAFFPGNGLALLFLLFFSCSFSANAQQAGTRNAVADSLLADSLTALAKANLFSDPEKSIQHADALMQLGRSSGQKRFVQQGYYLKGTAFYSKGFYKAAIENYLEAQKLAENIGDTAALANSYMVLGIVYYKLADYAKAEVNYSGAANLYRFSGKMKSLSAISNNIGLVQQQQGKYTEALRSFKESLALSDKIGADELSYSNTYSNIGLAYSKLELYDTAVVYLRRSYDILENSDEKLALAHTCVNLGTANFYLGNYDDARFYANKSLELATEIGNWELMANANSSLYDYYMHTGDIRTAMKFHLAADVARDSMLAQQNMSDIARLETEFEYEKKITRDSIKNASEKKLTDAIVARQDAELSATRNLQVALFSGLGLVAVFSLFMYNRFRVTRKQKQIIELQKNTVEIKQKEITDSINYAKRIQTAILPPALYFREHLPESFILYKPKDIVAGDFYWMEISGDKVLFAACDCTGHGVPGAMVSVICNNALNRSVREFGLLDPGKILDKAREIVITEFEKSQEEVRDGMDISLCVFDRRTYRLQWAGANNPLWLVRNGELIEYKPNKQPIGKYAAVNPFVTHDIETRRGDMLYVFTDGFADQFGGAGGKKFKTSALRETISSIHRLSPEEQRQELESRFENWRALRMPDGSGKYYEQVDDVCFIGVRL